MVVGLVLTRHNVLRWLSVLPAAVVASWLVRGSAPFLLSFGGAIDLRGAAYPEFLFPLLYYMPCGAAFTFVGAMTAPGNRRTTAAVLAAACIILSLMQHVLMHPNPGLTNYMDSTGESIGALLGVAAVLYLVRRARMKDVV